MHCPVWGGPVLLLGLLWWARRNRSCQTCKHWDRYYSNPFAGLRGAHPNAKGWGMCALTVFEDYDYSRYPDSLAICACWNRWAHLVTAPSFRCVQWKAK